MIRSIFLLFIIVFGISCQQGHLSKNEMTAILHERNEKLGLLFKAGDADKLAEMYSDSAKLCPNGADLYIGRTAIRDFWKQAMTGYKLVEMKTRTITIDGTTDVIYETGKTTTKLLFGDSVLVDSVKFANVWKRQKDGTYLLDVDIWNSLGN